MNPFKLNQLEKKNLSEKEMQNVQGGNERVCLCGCKYEGQPGGSSTDANGNANIYVGDYGGYSPDVPWLDQGEYRPLPPK